MNYAVFQNGQQVAEFPTMLDAVDHARRNWLKGGGDWQVQGPRDNVVVHYRDEMYRDPQASHKKRYL